jgi:uncharacterized protein YjbI with pentapeptide repeats
MIYAASPTATHMSFAGANLRSARLDGAVSIGTDLRGALLAAAKLAGADTTDVYPDPGAVGLLMD